MKPKLNPRKGWKYRLILCDNEGNYYFDDFNHIERAKSVVFYAISRFPQIKLRNLKKKEMMKNE